MSKTGIDALADLLREKQAVLNAEPGEAQAERARGVLIGALYFVQQFLGGEILSAAYGQANPSNRAEVLEIVARRALTLGVLFKDMPEDGGSLMDVVEEAVAVARGDAPHLFARLPNARKVSRRLIRAKLDALRWDAYLDGLSVAQHLRRAAIASAYAHEWDTISRWRRPAVRDLGKDHVEYRLLQAKVLGMRGEPLDDGMSADEDWEQAVAAAGGRFRTIQRATLSG